MVGWTVDRSRPASQQCEGNKRPNSVDAKLCIEQANAEPSKGFDNLWACVEVRRSLPLWGNGMTRYSVKAENNATVEVYGARNDDNWTGMARTFITLAIGLVGVVLINPTRVIVPLCSNTGMVWLRTRWNLNPQGHGNTEPSKRLSPLGVRRAHVQPAPRGQRYVPFLSRKWSVCDIIAYTEKSICSPRYLVARVVGSS